MSKEKVIKKKKYAPKMRFWVVFTPILAFIFGSIVFIADIVIRKSYSELNEAMFDYSECNQAISNFREASEYLTNQVRFFVLNQSPVFMNSFMYETQDIDRRNTAVKVVQMTHNGDAVDQNLSRAFRESEKLKDTEFYAMKLVCVATDISLDDIPYTIQNVNLSAEDMLLSSKQKIIKAQEMVYDYNYLAAKNNIMRYAAGAHNSLVEYYMQVQDENDAKILHLFTIQVVFVAFVLVAFLVFCSFIIIYVLIPIRKNVQCIENGKRMSLSGAYEVRTIGKAYNILCDKNAVTASVLKHKAEHDPLTGLINREAFENIKLAYTNVDEQIAYLMIDVDLFKQINDKYGHLAGDDVLRKISELLIDHFRNTDYVARVGGDEFAVIMTKLGDDPKSVIKRKIQYINQSLISMNDGLPSVSLSVGVSFGMGYSEELVHFADVALYRVKEKGRCNCAFYEEDFGAE